jgi:hypothetical protein
MKNTISILKKAVFGVAVAAFSFGAFAADYQYKPFTLLSGGIITSNSTLTVTQSKGLELSGTQSGLIIETIQGTTNIGTSNVILSFKGSRDLSPPASIAPVLFSVTNANASTSTNMYRTAVAQSTIANYRTLWLTTASTTQTNTVQLDVNAGFWH